MCLVNKILYSVGALTQGQLQVYEIWGQFIPFIKILLYTGLLTQRFFKPRLPWNLCMLSRTSGHMPNSDIFPCALGNSTMSRKIENTCPEWRPWKGRTTRQKEHSSSGMAWLQCSAVSVQRSAPDTEGDRSTQLSGSTAKTGSTRNSRHQPRFRGVGGTAPLAYHLGSGHKWVPGAVTMVRWLTCANQIAGAPIRGGKNVLPVNTCETCPGETRNDLRRSWRAQNNEQKERN